MGQGRLGPSYFFTSLVLGPLNRQHRLMVRTFLKVYMELGSYFLFLQEQIEDIINETKSHTSHNGEEHGSVTIPVFRCDIR